MAIDAFRLKENEDFYRRPTAIIVEEPTQSSREPTPAPQSFPIDAEECLVLSLDVEVKKAGSWSFGSDPRRVDYLLGHRGTIGTSGYHFSIIVDPEFRIWLDDRPRHGTSVHYDGGEVLENDNCLVRRPSQETLWTDVSIHLPNGLAFEITFPNHPHPTPEYLENLYSFASAVPLVNILGFDSNPTTAVPSNSQTPRRKPALKQ